GQFGFPLQGEAIAQYPETLPVSRFDRQCLCQHGTHAITTSINPYQSVCKPRQERCTFWLDFQTSLELRLGFLNFAHVHQSKPLANPTTGVLGKGPDGIFMKCQCFLPDVVVAEAQEHRDSHNSTCHNPSRPLVPDADPSHTCQKSKPEDRCVQESFRH